MANSISFAICATIYVVNVKFEHMFIDLVSQVVKL